MVHLGHCFLWCWNLDVRKVDHKYLGSFGTWCCRRLEKTSSTDRVTNEVLHRVKEERNIVNTIKRRKATWFAYVLPSDTCYWTKERMKGKTRKKRYATAGWPEGKERALEIEKASTSSHFLKNSLWQKLWALVRRTAWWGWR